MTITQKVLVGTGVVGLCLAAAGGALSTMEWDRPEQDTGTVEVTMDRDNSATPPNIVVLLADDAGYGDFGMTGSELFRTPRIDALTTEGVNFTNAYVTASVCSPSRAGLITGRYQQRFGHEANPPVAGGPTAGLPVEVQTLANMMKAQGYATAAIGKWHLGRAPHFHPNRRGFDYFYGFLKGERTYFPQEQKGPQDLKRNNHRAPEDFLYLTDELGDEAARWIGDNKGKPFFLYVAYNAVHMPLEALATDLEAQEGSLVGKRRRLAAMTEALDRSVGVVLDALETHDLVDDTVVVFLNDNGAGKQNEGDNRPFRGGKGGVYEGGIRVPFTIRWPGVVEAGTTYDSAVSAMDITATALAAGGGEPRNHNLDGVDLRPYITGEKAESPHPTLYWRLGETWAIRHENWKLLAHRGEPTALYDLDADIAEVDDRSAAQPDIVRELKRSWDAWNAQLVEPAFESNTERRDRLKAEGEAAKTKAKK